MYGSGESQEIVECLGLHYEPRHSVRNKRICARTMVFETRRNCK